VALVLWPLFQPKVTKSMIENSLRLATECGGHFYLFVQQSHPEFTMSLISEERFRELNLQQGTLFFSQDGSNLCACEFV
jgi:hypothetical protein